MEIPLTIDETQKSLISNKFSVVELIDNYYSRIKSFDNKINSYITLSQEKAYKKAKWTDKIIKDFGKKSLIDYPLLGVTVAVKDLFLTKGIKTTAASKVLEDFIPQYSSTVVVKLENAGCIILGKTNCDAWAHGASGENSDFGPTKNPWNIAYVPGGSSSGSAVAVAANFSLIATGTDTGGSIRQPANFCGVVGLKPTYGSVSRWGIVAMASSLDSIGHFTRVCKDARKVFNVTKGEDGKDATLMKTPQARSLHYLVHSSPSTETRGILKCAINSKLKAKRGKIRLGLPKEYFIDGINAEVKQSVISASRIFNKAGIEIVDVSLPHTKYAISVYYIIQPAEVSSNLGRYDGIRYGGKRDKFGAEAKRRIMLGTYVLSAGYYDAYYLKAMKVRTKIIEDFEKVFNQVDAIIAPVSPTPAFKLGEKASNPLEMYLADILTVAANIAGIPGISIPSGFSKLGLPLGFQLMGPRFSENLLFELGNTYEDLSEYKPNFAKLE